jgi:hypothetical protein
LTSQPKQKNNHFVPWSYLRSFSSSSDRQIALYNIKTGLTIPSAPIKSQCSRDYFYTQNPIFEHEFSKIEGRQKSLLNEIIATNSIPMRGSPARSELSSAKMFQAGRTATTVVHTDHLTNQFGKAILRHHLEREGKTGLLEYLPKVEIRTINAVMDAIGQHLAMYPLIDDLDCTLFLNETSEDFLTCDHPVALCNSMPATRATDPALGFASRGLIIVYPISPRALLFFNDAEVYKVENHGRTQSLHKRRDVVELNLAQFGNAYENVYFSDAARVQQTLETFRKRLETVRPPPPALSETILVSSDDRRRVLLSMPPPRRRLSLPKPVGIRYAARTGKYEVGNELVRDPVRALVVRGELDRLHKLREKSTKRAESEGIGQPDV